jgi:hypothetical protein
MKTIILAIVASVMLSATAHAQQSTCDGILVVDGYRLYIASQPSCVLLKNKADWREETPAADAVLAVCKTGDFCRITAITKPCDDADKCVTRALSVKKSVEHCDGVLRQEDDGRLALGVPQQEGTCEIVNPLAKWKVLAACRIGRWCRIYGDMEGCKYSGECSEITRVQSVKPLMSHPTIRLRAWQR